MNIKMKKDTTVAKSGAVISLAGATGTLVAEASGTLAAGTMSAGATEEATKKKLFDD